MQCNRNTNVWLVTNMYAATILQAIKLIVTKWCYMQSCGIRMKAILQKIFMNLIHNMCSEISLLTYKHTLLPYLTWPMIQMFGNVPNRWCVFVVVVQQLNCHTISSRVIVYFSEPGHSCMLRRNGYWRDDDLPVASYVYSNDARWSVNGFITRLDNVSLV